MWWVVEWLVGCTKVTRNSSEVGKRSLEVSQKGHWEEEIVKPSKKGCSEQVCQRPRPGCRKSFTGIVAE